MMPGHDSIEDELVKAEALQLLVRFEQLERDRQAEIAARKRAKFEKFRDDMRAGKWKPSHLCVECITSVLECRPSTCPETGRTGMWW